MLNVTGLNHFYYIRNFTNMRCKHPRVLSVIREQLQREPSDGDVFIFMSKGHRIFSMFSFDKVSVVCLKRSLFWLPIHENREGR